MLLFLTASCQTEPQLISEQQSCRYIQGLYFIPDRPDDTLLAQSIHCSVESARSVHQQCIVGVKYQTFMFLGRSDVALMVLLKAVRLRTVAIGAGAVAIGLGGVYVGLGTEAGRWAVCVGCRAVLRGWRAAARWR